MAYTQRRAERETYDVVGPVCETGDVIATDRPLAPVAAEDLLAVACAGAYGAVMASGYNSRLLVPEVLVDGRNVHSGSRFTELGHTNWRTNTVCSLTNGLNGNVMRI